ncbi:MAG: glyoxalase [Rhodobacterales bacterium]|nr:MAG: glyoxalase [Rhodobacterales bacterium]PIE06497.1 MAG: glyoxalase [Rhodobacterales bacterium]
MTQPIVCWTEIPVTDLETSVKFYNAVFGWKMEIDKSGPNPMAVFANSSDSAGGNLYPGKPAQNGEGPTAHIAVPGKLEEAMERLTKAGGETVFGPIEMPFGRFTYAKDLDGNSIGLFEPAAA